MGTSQLHALGRNRKFYINAETTYGTFVKPAADDAAKVLNATFTPAIERRPREDSRATRSHVELITGKESVTFSVEAYLIPNAAGAEPDLGPLIQGAMGGSPAITGSDVTYSLSAGQDLGSFSLVQFFNDTFMEAVSGAYVNSMTISVAGGEEPKITFDGEASTYIPTTTSPEDPTTDSTATVAASGTGDAFTVQTGEAANFRPGSILKIGTDPSNVDLEVESVNTSTDTVTMTASVPAGFTSGDAVVPYVPAETVNGSPIAGILGFLKFGTAPNQTTIPITTFEVTVANNNKPINDESFTQVLTDYVPGFRDVTGSLSVRCRRDLAIEIPKRLNHGNERIVVECGNVAGSTVEITIPKAEFDVAAVDTPQSDEVIIPMTFRALASASGEDELTVKFK